MRQGIKHIIILFFFGLPCFSCGQFKNGIIDTYYSDIGNLYKDGLDKGLLSELTLFTDNTFSYIENCSLGVPVCEEQGKWYYIDDTLYLNSYFQGDLSQLISFVDNTETIDSVYLSFVDYCNGNRVETTIFIIPTEQLNSHIFVPNSSMIFESFNHNEVAIPVKGYSLSILDVFGNASSISSLVPVDSLFNHGGHYQIRYCNGCCPLVINRKYVFHNNCLMEVNDSFSRRYFSIKDIGAVNGSFYSYDRMPDILISFGEKKRNSDTLVFSDTTLREFKEGFLVFTIITNDLKHLRYGDNQKIKLSSVIIKGDRPILSTAKNNDEIFFEIEKFLTPFLSKTKIWWRNKRIWKSYFVPEQSYYQFVLFQKFRIVP